MTWGKLHDDILGDPKLMRAARKGAMHLQVLPWLIAFAIKAADHGRLSVGEDPAEPEDIADQIPCVTAMQVAGALSELEAIGVLSEDPDGCLRFTKWEDRQAKPSSAKSAVLERVHKHRAKVKRAASKERNTTPALQGVTGSDEGGTDTPGKGTVTPRNATEREEEKRREKKENPASAGGRTTWITPYAVAWKAQYDGDLSIDPSVRPLGKLRSEHGDAETLRRWAVYLAAHEGRFANASKFAATWGEWTGEPAGKNGKPRQLAATETLFT